MIPDRVLIPLVLALYIAILVFTGALESMIIHTWERISVGFKMLSTPFGILLLSAGAGIGIIYLIRRRSK